MNTNRRLERIKILAFIGLFLMISIPSLVFSQDRQAKTVEIISKLELVENVKFEMIEFKIRPLLYQVSGNDSLEVREIEKQLTDEEILRRISVVFDERFTDEEINDVYNFLRTSAFEKFFNSGQIYQAINESFKDINAELNRIESGQRSSQDISIRKFEPIPVDRKNGFYEIIGNIPSNDYANIDLAIEPAITPKDIKEVKKTYRDYGDQGAEISLVLTEEGSQKFYLLTRANIAKQIAIVIENRIVLMPTVNAAITGGRVSIAGDFSEEEIDRMIEILMDEQ